MSVCNDSGGPSSNCGNPSSTTVSVNGRPRGGLLPMDENWGPVSPYWGIYLMVVDFEAMTAKASLGATSRMENHKASGVGQFSMMVDPQGAAFSMIRPVGM